jgi:hypothetical protein
LAFWGVLWGPLRTLHPLWQGKGAFLRLPRSTSASGYKHYYCYITMLQCLGQGYWECRRVEGTHTSKGQGENEYKSVAPYLLRISSCFLLSESRPNHMTSTKFKWGQSVAWLVFGIFFPPYIGVLFPAVPSHSVHDPRSTPEGKQTIIYEFLRVRIGGLCEEWCLFCSLTFPNISPASAPLPNLQALAERKEFQLSNACLRSRNCGVDAEICLRKVK